MLLCIGGSSLVEGQVGNLVLILWRQKDLGDVMFRGFLEMVFDVQERGQEMESWGWQSRVCGWRCWREGDVCRVSFCLVLFAFFVGKVGFFGCFFLKIGKIGIRQGRDLYFYLVQSFGVQYNFCIRWVVVFWGGEKYVAMELRKKQRGSRRESWIGDVVGVGYFGFGIQRLFIGVFGKVEGMYQKAWFGGFDGNIYWLGSYYVFLTLYCCFNIL